MKTFRLPFLLILLASFSTIYGQRLKKADKTIVSNIQGHISYLGNAKMEGRKAGTEGERSAGDYIRKQFEKWGLKPAADSGSWFQPFEIYDGREILPSTHFSINGQPLKLNNDFFPLPFSANKSSDAVVVMALSENGVPWFINLKDLIDGKEGNTDTLGLIRAKAVYAGKKGATGLIVYNSSSGNDLSYNKYDRSPIASIPVVYLTRSAVKKYCSDESASLDIKLGVELKENTRTGSNVVGYIDNGADSTIVTEAHLDNEKNVAALIELARIMNNPQHKLSNYVFIVYSGEDAGSKGKEYFTHHPSINLQQVNYNLSVDTMAGNNQKHPELNAVKKSVAMIEKTNNQKKPGYGKNTR